MRVKTPLLTVTGVLELVTGVALFVAPTLVARLLLGAEPVGVGLAITRFAGITLAALGIGCCAGSVWLGMWLYTALITVFLAYLGIATQWHSRLLWPAVGGHALLTVLLALPRRTPRTKAAR